MSELEIGLADGGELNFDKSLLQFNVKKIKYVKSSSQFCLQTLNTTHCKVKQSIYYYNNASFTLAFLSKKDNFFKM